ncbi:MULTISPECIES: autotransporter outer membrane beta-barrel domain-containing protein [Vibrio]|uniref:autotransporter outer membrane beta-barrel domain-containing protein n=1 Tax=Vibrio TaxID=662 RepID=UPI000C1722E8|nr:MULTISPECIES: autotransporter outer membrane beta-barrel domain-containing protein [Vibrio]NNN45518.1 autotransporter outer membrane beta-barrel domain-containing protein [Vibrio sp. 1-1(7)]NNN73198.1 autotransporter outer membrane beta-barrel domain-containing protein [Vibrio sp. 12-2(3-a)]
MSMNKNTKLSNLVKLTLATSMGFVFTTSVSANVNIDNLTGLAASGGADAYDVYNLKALYEYVNANQAWNSGLYQLLESATTKEEAAALASALSPDRSGASLYSVMSSQSLFSNTLRKRGTDFILGDYGNTSLWVSVLGADSSHYVTNDGSNRYDGYNSESTGIAFGYDLMRSSDAIVGLAFSQQKTDVKNRLTGRRLDIENYYAALHGLFKFDDIYISAQGIVGWSDYLSKHNVNGVPSYSGSTAEDATFGGDNYGVSADLYYPLYVGSFTVLPSVYANYQLVRVDGYKENQADNSLVVKDFDKLEHEALYLGVGVEVANSISTNLGIFSAQAKFKAKQEVLDHTTFSKGRLANSGYEFSAPIAQLDDTFYETNVDFIWETASNFSFNLGAQYSWSDSQDTTMFYGRGAYSF